MFALFELHIGEMQYLHLFWQGGFLFFIFFSTPLCTSLWSDVLWEGSFGHARCDVSKWWSYSKFTYEEEEHSVPSSWQIFSRKKEGTYVILKSYTADAEKILWEREKETVLLNSKTLVFPNICVWKNIVWPIKEIKLLFK